MGVSLRTRESVVYYNKDYCGKTLGAADNLRFDLLYHIFYYCNMTFTVRLS